MTVMEFYSRYKGIIKYVIFGALTTVLNVVTYHLLYSIFKAPNTLAVVIAWIISVAFAFVTNKLFVFESKSWDKKVAKKQALDFLVCRLATGVLEVALMFLLVDILKLDGTLMKLITNVIVIILNYIASKFVIFRK